MRYVAEVVVLAELQEPHGPRRPGPLLVVDQEARRLSSIHVEDLVPVGSDLMQQDVEKEDDADLADLAGHTLVAEIAGDEPELTMLARALLDD